MFLPDCEDLALTSTGDVWSGPRYNIAPTQSVTAVVQESSRTPRQLELFRWGLVPPWADDVSIGSRMINARCETLAEKPSFRKSFVHRRCLIVADGYYEWKTSGKEKQPMIIERSDGDVFAMAALWEVNHKASNTTIPIRSCTVITTEGNDLTKDIHDRMPVILDPKHFDRWLDPENHDTASLQSLLVPVPNERLRLTPVSKHVGNVRNSDASCSEPTGESVTWH